MFAMKQTFCGSGDVPQSEALPACPQQYPVPAFRTRFTLLQLQRAENPSMDTTGNLDLPYILPSQAQKHVTHNEALRRLDAIVQLSCASRALASPPASPVEGSRYLVPASPTGVWSGMAGRIAAWQDGAWAFYQPRKGWLAWIEDEAILLAHDGTRFVEAAASPNGARMFGINATADTANRLAVSSPAVLFNHAGNGHQVKINKNAAADTASILFQTGFSGRAEFGLTGDNDFRVKISANGTQWRDAVVMAGNGNTTFGGTVRLAASTVAGLPPAAGAGAGALIYVTNESGGAVVAFSDGTAWRRVTDRAIVT